jgi:hypothetical protein
MVTAEEWLEYLVMVYRGNAWTAIRYDHLQFAVAGDAGGYIDWSIDGCVLDGVLQ